MGIPWNAIHLCAIGLCVAGARSTGALGATASDADLTRAVELIDSGQPDAARRILAAAFPDHRTHGPSVAFAMAATYLDEGDCLSAQRWYGIALAGLGDDERAFYDDVHPIATAAEFHALRALNSEEKRRSWRRRFWAARDPTPATPTNERLLHHFRRAWYASRHHSLPDAPHDDRAAIYIRFGEPDRREAWSPGVRQEPLVERWQYVVAGGQSFVAEFVDPLHLGEYRLRALPPPVAGAETETDGDPRIFPLLFPMRRSPDEFVPPFGRNPLDAYATISQFAGSDGHTTVNVYYGIRCRDLRYVATDSHYVADIEKGVVIYDSTGDVVERTIDTTRVRIAAPIETWAGDSIHVGVYQFSVVPGRKIGIGMQVRDLRTGRMQAFRGYVRAEPFATADLMLSGVVLAGRVRQSPKGSTSPFALDGHEVYAMPARWFDRGALLHVYYEIYNLSRGPDYGETEYEVVHTLRRAGDRRDGWFAAVARRAFGRGKGASVSVGQTIEGMRDCERRTFALDTANLEPGSYVLTIAVRDERTGRRARREQVFRIGVADTTSR